MYIYINFQDEKFVSVGVTLLFIINAILNIYIGWVFSL